LVTRHPVPLLGWGVLVEIPAQEIDKAIWQFERPLAFHRAFCLLDWRWLLGLSSHLLYPAAARK